MAKVTPISEHFQHFLAEMKQTFLGGFYGQTKLAWQRFFELQPERQRDRRAEEVCSVPTSEWAVLERSS